MNSLNIRDDGRNAPFRLEDVSNELLRLQVLKVGRGVRFLRSKLQPLASSFGRRDFLPGRSASALPTRET
jgi:hypothetical protein